MSSNVLNVISYLIWGLCKAGVASGTGPTATRSVADPGRSNLLNRFLLLPRFSEGVVDIGVVIDKAVGITRAAVLLRLSPL